MFTFFLEPKCSSGHVESNFGEPVVNSLLEVWKKSLIVQKTEKNDILSKELCSQNIPLET